MSPCRGSRCDAVASRCYPPPRQSAACRDLAERGLCSGPLTMPGDIAMIRTATSRSQGLESPYGSPDSCEGSELPRETGASSSSGLKRSRVDSGGQSQPAMKRSGSCRDLGKAHLVTGVPLERSGLSGSLDDLGLGLGFGRSQVLQPVNESHPMALQRAQVELLRHDSVTERACDNASPPRACDDASPSRACDDASPSDEPIATGREAEGPDARAARDSDGSTPSEPSGDDAPPDTASDETTPSTSPREPSGASPDSLTRLWGSAVADARAGRAEDELLRASSSSALPQLPVVDDPARDPSPDSVCGSSPTVSKACNFVRVVGGFS